MPCFLPLAGNWGQWSNYTACTADCGGGLMNRTRICNDPEPLNNGLFCPGNDTEVVECNTLECPIGKFVFFKLLEQVKRTAVSLLALAHLHFFVMFQMATGASGQISQLAL